MVVLFPYRLECGHIAKKHKNQSSRRTNLERCIWRMGLWGSVEDSNWFQLPWGDSPLAAASIAVKELLPILFARATWGVNWQGCTVCCHSDNQTMVWVINNLNPKDPLLSHMLRCLFFISAKFDFDLIACHFCPGPQSSKDPSHLPPVLVESFKQILDWNSCRWTSWFSSFLAMPLPLLHYVLINQQSNAITISVLPRT